MVVALSEAKWVNGGWKTANYALIFWIKVRNAERCSMICDPISYTSANCIVGTTGNSYTQLELSVSTIKTKWSDGHVVQRN